MGTSGTEMHTLEERIATLPPEDQLHLLEWIGSHIRRTYFTDHDALGRAMAEMAADPGMQRVLRNEDIRVQNAAG